MAALVYILLGLAGLCAVVWLVAYAMVKRFSPLMHSANSRYVVRRVR